MTYKYSSKPYLHFDRKVSFDEKVEKYVNDYEINRSHNFLPLIYSEVIFERYKKTGNNKVEYVIRKGEKVPVVEKKRPIMYASHIDNFIYKHYGLQINELYNKYAKDNGFDDSVLAYRDNKNGKSNIHFAAEIVNYIASNPECYIYVGDYTKFFESLNHNYLKERLSNLYGNEKIPGHQFKIFKSLTKFAFIHKENINMYLGSDKEINKGSNKYFDSFKEFRAFKKMGSLIENDNGKMLKINNLPYGIPQGTAISAIYSNIYMIEIDKYISKIVGKENGIYRRYSDDFIIILPKVTKQKFEEIKGNVEKEILAKTHLEIHPDKTKLMMFDGKNIVHWESGEKEKLDYLGFVYDGYSVKMREKSIHKYYRTAYKLISKGEIISRKKRNTGKNSRLTYKRKLYQGYHQLGEQTDYKYKYKKRNYGTFITYANKCQKVFDKLSPITVKNSYKM